MNFLKVMIAATLVAGLPAGADDGPLPVTVRIVPGPRTVGSTVVVEIVLGADREISAFQFALEYDPSVLRPVSPTRPWVIGPAASGMVELYNYPVNYDDRGRAPTGPHSDGLGYALGDFTIGARHGPGVLCTTSFTVISEGNSPLRFPNPYGFWTLGTRDNPAFIDDTSYEHPLLVTPATFSNLPPGVIVTPAAGVIANESGGNGHFSVSLRTPPMANVELHVSSSNPGQATVQTQLLTFTPATWAVPQIVTVSGVDDIFSDGDVTVAAVIAPASSVDPAYNNLETAPVPVVVQDNDQPAVLIDGVEPATTNEAGDTFTFKAKLSVAPTAAVTLNLSSSKPGEALPAPVSLTFTAADWSVARTVTVTGIDDLRADGNVEYAIVTDVNSTDLRFATSNPPDVKAVNIDDDVIGIVIAPHLMVRVDEGRTNVFTVALVSEPTANVTISLTSGDIANATVAPPSLTFTPMTWAMPQTVTVSGIDDDLDDGDRSLEIVTGHSASGDSRYHGIDIPNVDVIVRDNDTSGVAVTSVPDLRTTEVGGTASFSLKLTCRPTATVQIPVSSSDTTEGTVSLILVEFAPAAWNVPQTVVVRGVDDPDDDGSVPYLAVLGAIASDDDNYEGMDPADVAVTNDGDDADLSLWMAADTLTPREGGEVSFAVALMNSSQTPAGSIVVGLTLPAGLICRSVTAGSGRFDESRSEWLPDALASGEEVTLVLVADVAQGIAGTPATVRAAIRSSDQHDPNATNDVRALILNIESLSAAEASGGEEKGGGGGCGGSSGAAGVGSLIAMAALAAVAARRMA